MDINQIPIISIDERRELVIPGTAEETLKYCVEHFIATANEAIEADGNFTVALSGGSTPKGIFQLLALPENRSRVDWKKVLIFWGDERAVPPSDPDSNYRMAIDSGIGTLGIPDANIFRMVAEEDIEENAQAYEKILLDKLSNGQFDMIMLGMGDDGHTASLFPHTQGLHSEDRFVIANYINSKNIWRMTLTYDCINRAKTTVIYVIGKGKKETLSRVLEGPYIPDELPSQKIGTQEFPVLWIADLEAAEDLLKQLKDN